MSARNLQRIFKQETGITLQKYMQLVRILRSIELIDTNNFTRAKSLIKSVTKVCLLLQRLILLLRKQNLNENNSF